MDDIELLYQFGTAVANALQAAGVKPPPKDTDTFCAMLVIVGQEGSEAPLGGSMNYDYDKGVWTLSAQAEVSQKCTQEEHEEVERRLNRNPSGHG